ncbi:MAG: DUF362 domain-containing protein [Acidobacteriota bacterium]
MAGQRPTPLGLVESTHPKLARPSSLEDPLDYERVRDMVWKAIEYGAPRAGSLEAKIKPGSWVVVKPNYVFLRPQRGYRTGDVTDLRVTRAVVEYLARRSRAGRITIAEGGSYRGRRDPLADNAVQQNGARVDLASFDWGADEFPGTGGSAGAMLNEFQSGFPGKKFDCIDLSYDAVRDASGAFRRIEVPRTARGVGAFGARPDYYVTNTIRNCDFLITVPVIKIHDQCAITTCFKNYVGTAPREANQVPGAFHNQKLHDDHECDNRIDGFIVDLAAFHPPDYCVADGIRGLQYTEHNNGRPDQMLRNNFVLAGEDPVAADALIAHLMGFNVRDMEFLHMAAQRDLGTMDLSALDLRGDDPERVRKVWGKPRDWYGRANRDWLLSADPAADLRSWKRHVSTTDTLDLAKLAGGKLAPGAAWGAAVRVHAAGHRKAHLWLGLRGRAAVTLNGQTVMEQENRTRYRVGQFRAPVELRSGENLLVCRVQALTEQAQFSLLLVGPPNDGDTVEGIRWSA